MSRASYSVVVAVLIDVLLRSLVTSFVYSAQFVEIANGWVSPGAYGGIGLGAVATFAVFSIFAAQAIATSSRLAPINALRLATGIFLLFSVFALLPADKALFIISFSILGLAATTGSVLIWWAHGQDQHHQVVLQRYALISAFSNVPIAILGTLMHTYTTFHLVASVAAVLVATLSLACLQQRCYTKCFRVPQPIPNAAARVFAPGYDEPYVYDDENHTYNHVEPVKPADSNREAQMAKPDITDLREAAQFTLDDESSQTEAKSEADVTVATGPEERAFRQEAAENTVKNAELFRDLEDPIPNGETKGISTRTSWAYTTPDAAAQAKMSLWMGPWTAVIVGTIEALMYYNVAGFSTIGAPWYVTSIAIGFYSTVIAIVLPCWQHRRRVNMSNLHATSDYLVVYKRAVTILIFSTLLHASLEMSPWARFYQPHVVLSLVYMPPLATAAAMPLVRTYEFCHKMCFSFYLQLPRWFMAVVIGRAVACVFEYVMLSLDAQMIGMIVLSVLNVITYNAVRRSDVADSTS